MVHDEFRDPTHHVRTLTAVEGHETLQHTRTHAKPVMEIG